MIKIESVSKIYKGELYETKALDHVTLNIKEGEFVSIMGPSGSGKSTLLNIIGCMDSVTSGKYLLDNTEINSLKPAKLNKLRKKYIGFVFQHFALMDYYTAYENVELPLLAQNVPHKLRKKIINEQLESLGIKEIADKKPSKMSGGQQQRVAIARALAADSKIILADEPTGALDQATGHELMEILKKINKEGKTIILVTHDENVAGMTKRIIRICDGKIVEDKEVHEK